MAECIWGSVGNELGHAFDVGQRNISSESIFGEQLRNKLRNKEVSNSREEDHHHREAVGKVGVAMVMDVDVGHSAGVLDMLKLDSRH